jgi:hypothetical protein
MAPTVRVIDDEPGPVSHWEQEMDEGMRWLTQELAWADTYDAYRRAFDIEEEIVAPITVPSTRVRIFAPTAASAMRATEL